MKFGNFSPREANFLLVLNQFSKAEICDFDGNFYWTHIFCSVSLKMPKKNMSSKSQDPDLYDYEKVMFIHTVIDAQLHAGWTTFVDRSCMYSNLL